MGFGRSTRRIQADRIIGATALVHGMSLVTRDERIRESGELPCAWEQITGFWGPGVVRLWCH
jgi:hypothetical protein